MDLFFYLIIFLFGLAVGSFLNCVVYRLETGGSFLKGRSCCPHCKHKLSWQDLIPVFSFFILRGKCRYCQKRISLQYPLVELTTGLLFVLLFIVHCSLFIFVITCFLIVIFIYDLKHYIIPDKVIYPAIGVAFLYSLFGIWDLGFGILPSLFFLAIIIFSRGRWMGLGDFKLAILMGLILGWPNILVALFLAFFFGAIIGVGLMVFSKKTLKSEVPFGPFLVTGTFIALFWGKAIIQWYLQLVMN